MKNGFKCFGIQNILKKLKYFNTKLLSAGKDPIQLTDFTMSFLKGCPLQKGCQDIPWSRIYLKNNYPNILGCVCLYTKIPIFELTVQ